MARIYARYVDIFSRMREVPFYSQAKDISPEITLPVGSAGSGAGRALAHEDGVFMPDPDTQYIESGSVGHEPQTVVFGFLKTHEKDASLPWDTRATLQRALDRLESKALNPEHILVAPELEFYVFRKAEIIVTPSWQLSNIVPVSTFGHLQDDAMAHLSGLSPLQAQPWQLATEPFDGTAAYRKALYNACHASGIPVLRDFTEGGTGQVEFNLAPLPPLQAADMVLKFKALAQKLAGQMELQVSFMPKPYAQGSANGMHWNISFGPETPCLQTGLKVS